MCQHTQATHTSLPAAVGAAKEARAVVCRSGCRRHGAHLLPAAELVVSELVTNAVRHGAPPVSMEVDCVYGAGVVLRVSDEGGASVRVHDPRVDEVEGRGMKLVTAVASDWGVDPRPGGEKTVWVTLDPERMDPPF